MNRRQVKRAVFGAVVSFSIVYTLQLVMPLDAAPAILLALAIGVVVGLGAFVVFP